MMNMIKITGVLATAVFIFSSAALADSADIKKKLETATLDDRISYAIGFDVCDNLKDNFTVNPDLFFQGVKDSLDGTPGMTDFEIKEAIKAYQNLARKKQLAVMGEKAAENKAAGTAFLEQNRSKEGVTVLDSGLQYRVLTEGSGDSPKLEDKVSCHYKGTLIDGTEFDSSYKRNQPAVFPVNGVIKGWTEALQLMKVGAKWMLYIPSDLAYGDRGAGQAIEPGSTLIFEVELLSIEK